MVVESYDDIYRRLKNEGYEAWTGSGFTRARQRLSEVLYELEEAAWLPDKGTVLELGCGNGAMASHYFARQSFVVYGVDISDVAICWARERFREAGLVGHFNQGNVCDLSLYNDAQFDVIVDGSCFHCLVGTQRTHCLKAVRRVLACDGTLIISSMCGSPKQISESLRYDPGQHLLLKDGIPWRTLKPLDDLTAEITAAGFNIRYFSVNQNSWWDHATLVCHKASS
ncbi:class I SAM-dependent methyltransferase [Pantoea stewartii]|uniref:class I SAM-dependent methyltransferase n=1 Tax=Pantoea stewartii TaxID=66269 RepID=UPI002FCAAF03